ncbi:MAG: thiamine-phosphate kinase [Armatimonadetes bacterium]|nr:thiamine-phosphate kinase [Armatimonadota bacterium]
MRFSQWGELAFHRWLVERFGQRSGGSIGNDAAVVEVGGVRVAITVDVSVDGVHFQAGWLTWREIGYRAACANISDLAAACAEPLGVMASLGVPPDVASEAICEVTQGIAEAGEQFSAPLLGGDTSASPVLFIDIVAFGVQRAAWSRSRAAPGDVLAVTGQLGAPSAAVALLKAGLSEDFEAWPVLRARFARPVPRVREALALAAAGVQVNAAIDLSDGLLLDASRLCEASGVSATIFADSVPVAEGVPEAADLLGRCPLEFAVAGGEDYELLLALPSAQFDRAAEALAGAGCSIAKIGEIGQGSGVAVVDSTGRELHFPAAGYEHYGGRTS